MGLGCCSREIVLGCCRICIGFGSDFTAEKCVMKIKIQFIK